MNAIIVLIAWVGLAPALPLTPLSKLRVQIFQGTKLSPFFCNIQTAYVGNEEDSNGMINVWSMLSHVHGTSGFKVDSSQYNRLTVHD